MPILSPSSISSLYYPAKCELRGWLKRHKPELEVEDFDAFQEFLREEGDRHEKALLEELLPNFPDWVDAGGRKDKRAREKTENAVSEEKDLIFQGMLIQDEVEIGGEKRTVLGYPDFMLKQGDGYTIADAKLARSIYKTGKDDERRVKNDKRYIELQLQLYGWLFSRQFPGLDFELLILNGKGEREGVPYDGGDAAFEELERLLRIETHSEEPWEPVGWSKCGACGFKEYCWENAERVEQTGLVPDLSQALGHKLRDQKGIESYLEMLERMDATDLAEMKNVGAGAKNEKNLAGAVRILENARALRTGEAFIRGAGQSELEVLFDDNYVMFDLEGVPFGRDSNERIYLWGLQVFGEEMGEFRPAFAHFGEDGDERGWNDFLKISREILDEHPGIRFVHWAKYEKTKINQYMRRFADSDLETAEEVKGQLLNLLDVAKAAVAIPASSYSLKVVEQLPQVHEVTGFKRGGEGESADDEIKSGDQSIAAYMTAVETNDQSERDRLMEQLARYNQQDLEATWAVQQWLRSLA
jgi:predicted RecB family nuclease